MFPDLRDPSALSVLLERKDLPGSVPSVRRGLLGLLALWGLAQRALRVLKDRKALQESQVLPAAPSDLLVRRA